MAKSSGGTGRFLRRALLALAIAGVAGSSTGCVLWVHDDDHYRHHHYDHDEHWEHHDHD